MLLKVIACHLIWQTEKNFGYEKHKNVTPSNRFTFKNPELQDLLIRLTTLIVKLIHNIWL